MRINPARTKIFWSVILAMFVSPAMVSAQATEYGSFRIAETEISYQKVFNQDSVTSDKLAEFFKTLPNVSNVAMSGESVTADLVDLVVDYKKFKFPQVSTPPIIQTGNYSGKITAEARDGKYRITIKSMTVKGDIGYKKIPEPESLTRYACTNSGTVLARDWCKPNMLGLLDMAITDRLLYKEQKKDSDW